MIKLDPSLLPSTQDLPISNDAGQPTGIVLKVVGTNSKSYREAVKRSAKSMLGKEAHQDFDLIERNNAHLAAACIVGWTGLLDERGEPVPYSPQTAIELMLMPELTYMKEAVEGFAADKARFFRPSDRAADGVRDAAGEAGLTELAAALPAAGARGSKGAGTKSREDGGGASSPLQ
jgi:hypothetical protein